MVYVFVNPDGSVDHTLVSACLKNPESLVSLVDVSDFSLVSSVIVFTSHPFEVIANGNFDSLGNLGDAVTQLGDAANRLEDGSSELAFEMASLLTGTVNLDDGIRTLSDGISSLFTESEQLAEGTKRLSSGAKLLRNSKAPFLI